MITWCRILLFETLLVLFVDNDKSESLEWEEDGTSRTQYHVIRGL